MPQRSVSDSATVKTPVCRIHRSARDGSGAASIRRTSPHTRSADSRSIPPFSFAEARSPSASGRCRPYQAKKRKKRRMRRWSSSIRRAASPTKRTVRECTSPSTPSGSKTVPSASM